MLIKTSYRDVPTKANGRNGTVRIYLIEPNLPQYPQAKFPGCVVFSEIYQVTGPVERFAGNIASEGYIVALPSSFHEFEGPEAIPYDNEGTDRGNKYKIEKTVEAYDEVGLTQPEGTKLMDIGCHPFRRPPDLNAKLYRQNSVYRDVSRRASRITRERYVRQQVMELINQCAFDSRVLSTFCYFATDVHSATLGKGKSDDTLLKIKSGDLTDRGEITLVFGKHDTHVDRAGRTLIRETLDDAGVTVTFLEVQAQHAFIRDESSKGRWDAALSRSLFAMMMEQFNRIVARDLGPKAAQSGNIEHVC